MTQILRRLADVPPGWHRICTELHAQLVALEPDYRLIQIKEKLGGLRVYLHPLPDAVDARCYEAVRAAEKRCAVTCQRCAAPAPPGHIAIRAGWRATLCQRCAGDSGYGMFDDRDLARRGRYRRQAGPAPDGSLGKVTVSAGPACLVVAR